ncbi:alpha-L-rhamnosidase [Sphingomonas laterariae]|uniref:alpha-L-rhamnosidase n=1 Tax=Edaphosphingomonas laterariae TaxID=861865 RepID=A0A239I2I4_9SPHN|nr:alpha-L-rhamnosidase [Sphingomonas laterariae]SNS86574.1 alpha-L-rhamnosidase [Sphingomonas laterariae]
MDIDRRSVLGMGFAAAGSIGHPALAAQEKAAMPFAVVDLRLCALAQPMATGNQPPRFSWKLAGGDAGLKQHAYRVTVARSEADLLAARNLVWDSGEVVSDRSFDIAYDGPKPAPRTRYWWRVELRAAAGAPPVASAAEFWETGLAAPSDWSAKWLACETDVARLDRLAGLHWIGAPTLQKVGQVCHFRTVIDGDGIDGDGGSASQLLLSAAVPESLWLNGKPLVAEQDDPVAWTTMATYALPLARGRNVLALSVKRESGLGMPAAMFASIIRLGGAQGRRITSAAGWKCAMDAPAGWQQRDFDDGAWAAAAPVARKPVGEPWPDYPAVLLRRDFSTTRPIRSARLYATALGVYEAWINGRRVGDGHMAPQFTNPAERALYQAHDVTALLRPGENAIGLWVGDGWYGSEYSNGPRFSFGPAPCRVQAQLELTFEDGSTETIATGDGWSIGASPILSSEIYDGEVYDARLEQPGWANAGYRGANWRPAELVDAPAFAPEPELCPPVRATQTLAPRDIRTLRPGVHVVDFGQNFAGWLRLKLRAAAGTRIEMRFAEIVNADGSVDQANLRTASARDIYIAKGQGEELWEPRFTYHGFRYVELRGLAQAPTADMVQAIVAHTDLPLSGTLRVGDPVIQKFWQNAMWSQRSNFFGLPTDCPQRDERLGWMGDAQVFWPAAAYNMDVEAYTARVMRDMRAAQGKNGAFPDVIPPFTSAFNLSSPGWADAGVILPYTAWRQYGDTAIIDENWEAMDRYLGWIQRANPDHLWVKSRGADYGDWLSVDAKNPQDATTPKDLIATAYWAGDAQMMAAMTEAAGRADDAARYRALFDAIRTAFNRAFVAADGTVGNGSQTGYVLALHFGLLPQAARAEAGRRLAADIERRGNTLSTGFLGTPHILDALAGAGQAQMAITLLMQRNYPSWGYMVEKGATTMWERWNSDAGDTGMNSRNHYAFGAIGDFLFRRIAGIAAMEPGFRRVRIAPIFDRRLQYGGADYRSPAGLIRTDWRYQANMLVLDVALPPNVAGVVSLPAKPGRIAMDGRPLAKASTRSVRQAGDGTEVEIGAGRHSFSIAV